jgi:hypothetical protein
MDNYTLCLFSEELASSVRRAGRASPRTPARAFPAAPSIWANSWPLDSVDNYTPT